MENKTKEQHILQILKLLEDTKEQMKSFKKYMGF